jgi:amino acid transporter
MKLKRIIANFFSSLLLTTVVAIPLVMAQAPTIPKPDFMPGPQEGATAEETQNYLRNQAIPSFTAGFIGLIGGLALLVLVWSGIRFITAYGDEEAVTNAKKTATWAAIGFGISILSYTIVATVATLNIPDADNQAGEQEDVIYRTP